MLNLIRAYIQTWLLLQNALHITTKLIKRMEAIIQKQRGIILSVCHHVLKRQKRVRVSPDLLVGPF